MRELTPSELFEALVSATRDPLFQGVLQERPTSEGWEPFVLEDD